MNQLGDVTKNLLILNIIAFFAVTQFLHFWHLDPYFTLVTPGESYMINEIPYTFKPIQIITHMFMHADPHHLLFNMLGLYLFGTHVERLLGPKKFFILYIGSGLVAAIAQVFIVGGMMVGASGALYGITIAFATMLPNIEMTMFPIPFPIKAKYLAILMLGYGIFAEINGVQGNIGHVAHVAGGISGFILVTYWGLARLR
jgi:membrane associated rhomboid family serine protease